MLDGVSKGVGSSLSWIGIKTKAMKSKSGQEAVTRYNTEVSQCPEFAAKEMEAWSTTLRSQIGVEKQAELNRQMAAAPEVAASNLKVRTSALETPQGTHAAKEFNKLTGQLPELAQRKSGCARAP